MKTKVLIILLVFSLLLNFALLMKETLTTDAIVEINDNTSLSLYTEAVCENVTDGTQCHDEVFIQCGDIETKLGNVLGNSPTFELDWEDPRE